MFYKLHYYYIVNISGLGRTVSSKLVGMLPGHGIPAKASQCPILTESGSGLSFPAS